MGFTRDELEACRGETLPDLVGPGLRLLFVGINPGLWTAAAQAHFARRGNRFYPALHRAGITDHEIDAAEGYDDADVRHLVERGIGITNLVEHATARADEITIRDLRDGARRLREFVGEHEPSVVAILGITAYRTAFDSKDAGRGRQQQDVEGAVLYVLGNPSGLNAHQSVESLAKAMAEAADEAGIDRYRDP